LQRRGANNAARPRNFSHLETPADVVARRVFIGHFLNRRKLRTAAAAALSRCHGAQGNDSGAIRTGFRRSSSTSLAFSAPAMHLSILNCAMRKAQLPPADPNPGESIRQDPANARRAAPASVIKRSTALIDFVL